MNTKICWLLGLFFLFSCSVMDHREKDGSEMTPKQNPEVSTSSIPNTINLGSLSFSLESISEEEFEAQKLNWIESELGNANPRITKGEKDRLTLDSTAERLGDTLILLPSNADPIQLVNADTDGDDMLHYEYRYRDALSNTWLIEEYYWEGMGYRVIDCSSGNDFETAGYPAIAPNGQYFLCGNVDLEAQYTKSGFWLYKRSGNGFEKIGALELEDWGPDTMHWINDSTLIAKMVTGVVPTAVSYRKLTLTNE